MAGFEPARVAPAEFKSAASAVPPHPPLCFLLVYSSEWNVPAAFRQCIGIG